MTLTEFLLARIAEDEDRLIHEIGCERFEVRDYGTRQGECDCHAITRLQAECEAKRRIVAEHSPVDPCDAHDADYRTIPCDTLLFLASIYADHPDYRDEWRP